MTRTLEQVISEWDKDGVVRTYAGNDLTLAIKNYLAEEIERCLKDNDSKTHIIAKDLKEKLGL